MHKIQSNFLNIGKLLCLCMLIYILFLIFDSQQGFSQSNDITVVKRVIDEFYTESSGWAAKLENSVKDLFVLCFTLELVMLGITAVMKRENLEDIFASMTMAVLSGAFILACIMNYQEWSYAIMVGISDLAGITGYDVKAFVESPIQKGFEIYEPIMKNISFWDGIGEAIAFCFFALFMLICFALITIQIIYIKCEAFVAVGAGFILLGFGGCHFFKDYAINLMRYILSVGFKLYVLYVVLGLGFATLSNTIDPTGKLDFQTLGVMLVISLVLLSLCKSLPDVAAGIIQGAHVNTGGNMMRTVQQAAGLATMAAGGAVVASKMAGGAVSNARKAANVARDGGARGFTAVASGAMKNMWQAGMQARTDRQRSESENPNSAAHKRMGGKLNEMSHRNQAQQSQTPTKKE